MNPRPYISIAKEGTKYKLGIVLFELTNLVIDSITPPFVSNRTTFINVNLKGGSPSSPYEKLEDQILSIPQNYDGYEEIHVRVFDAGGLLTESITNFEMAESSYAQEGPYLSFLQMNSLTDYELYSLTLIPDAKMSEISLDQQTANNICLSHLVTGGSDYMQHCKKGLEIQPTTNGTNLEIVAKKDGSPRRKAKSTTALASRHPIPGTNNEKE